MHKDERDPHTGYKTTGHEWNGIKELNTPIPRAILLFIIVTHLFALGYWIFMPAWPLGDTYTKGLLGADQKKRVEKEVAEAAMSRQAALEAIERQDYNTIVNDLHLMALVRENGKTLFRDNCSACHGAQGQGQSGFPSLADNDWLWGNSPEQIAKTIRVGVNADHPESRSSEMLAFGRDQLLQRGDVLDLVSYIESLSGKVPKNADSADSADSDGIALPKGQSIFAENCATCHGADAKGSTETGAPDLTDDIWIYGAGSDTIFHTIWDGRKGVMPSWDGRLTPLQQKILTLYVLGLNEEEQ
ncbi:MAG: cytochrome-c oxidase, cbb3-type subunit III [Alphaproteobacteria bacterium]|nr:cytochrome-c oxidase, cbb3-type subunit III [Alphaproteobacteria bacterium]